MGILSFTVNLKIASLFWKEEKQNYPEAASKTAN